MSLPDFHIKVEHTHILVMPAGEGWYEKLKGMIMGQLLDEMQAAEARMVARFDAGIAHMNQTIDGMRAEIETLRRRVEAGEADTEEIAAFRRIVASLEARINVLNPDNQETLTSMQAALEKIDAKAARETKKAAKGAKGRKD